LSSVFTSSPLSRPQDAVVEGGVLLLPLSTVLFFILFFYLLYLHNTRCGLYFWSLSSSFRRMSCNCTHRKILPTFTPRNAGGISPRARSRGNPSHFLSERPERKCAKKESPTPLYWPVLFLYQWC